MKNNTHILPYPLPSLCIDKVSAQLCSLLLSGSCECDLDTPEANYDYCLCLSREVQFINMIRLNPCIRGGKLCVAL